jgi:hypothetical protein
MSVTHLFPFLSQATTEWALGYLRNFRCPSRRHGIAFNWRGPKSPICEFLEVRSSLEGRVLRVWSVRSHSRRFTPVRSFLAPPRSIAYSAHSRQGSAHRSLSSIAFAARMNRVWSSRQIGQHECFATIVTHVPESVQQGVDSEKGFVRFTTRRGSAQRPHPLVVEHESRWGNRST